MEQTFNHPVTATRFAGFWIRVAAYLIDVIIAGAIASILSRMFFGSYYFYSDADTNPAASGMSLLVNWLYFAYQESSTRQATIGKLAVGIKVCTEDGAQLSFANATGRFFAKILSAIVLLIGFIMVAFDSKRQGLHDKLARTIVVYP